ncbi:universal stress protein [Aestuariirhabdus litorea]|uniref:Universal stress protein n=1 Tax=Aestuariirhabdus litorea TaxID=2528527 RepID=A0A3P3VMR6_9GAMM|nr:universal stress protein [Aestuariirhabdus litorea]RRJ83188.1 universal stress protein [Aestuariirhabdus litorea]RWW93345.1 universal stress protein [Endozoicomonadaceae bacterium GTF-13]
MLPEVKTIIYATSLGKHTRPVFRQAIKMAQAYNARIIMIHALEPVSDFVHAMVSSYLPEGKAAELRKEGEERILQQMKQRVEKFYEEEMSDLPDVGNLVSHRVVAESNLVDLVMRTIEKFDGDMVVLGCQNSFGHHSQTAAQLVRHSPVPVLVVPNNPT